MKTLPQKTIIAIFLLTAVSGCSDVYAQGIARKAVRDFSKVESYQGRVVERGAIDGKDALVSDVVYQKPFKVRSQVVSPAQHAGELFLYDGKRMVMWFPQALFGIEVVGFKNPNNDEVLAHTKRLTREAMRAYAFSLRSQNRRVAGQRATEWKIIPTRRQAFRIPHTIWNHRAYAMPLKIRMTETSGAPWYSMEFENIRYNQALQDSAFRFEFPANAVVFRWDLSAPGLSEAQARQQMNFDLRLPKKLPRGHSVQKIVKSPHCLPAVMITMNRGASWLSLTESRHIPGLLAPRGKRVSVGGETGFLSFMGTFSSVTWVKGNTQMTLTGNLSFIELLDVAASVE